MKHIHIFTMLMISLVLFSCNEGNKAVKPASEKINGPLGEYFQLVQSDFPKQDGRAAISFKRIKEGWPVPVKTNAPLGDCDECYEPSLMAEFMDQDGNVLVKAVADCFSSPEQMTALMDLKLDEIGSISFPVASKGVRQVKILSDFVYHGIASSNLLGVVGESMDILMSLEFSPQNEAKGAYYHKKFGPNALLYLKGSLDGTALVLDEYTAEGKRLGKYNGAFKDGTYVGIYEAFDGKTYDFSLAEDELMFPVDFTGVDFGGFSDELAFQVNSQEDYEQFYQEMFESQGILLSAKDTMQLMLNKEQLELVVGESDTLVLTSYHAAMPITWSSSDEAVAMVGSHGVVRAIGEGEAFIVASVQPNKRDTITTQAYVKVKPVPKKSSAPAKPQAKTSSINLGYATYEPLPQDGMSGVKDGKPHGNGIMRFKSSHIIPGTQDCTAEAGEWVNGMWRDGKINVGTWYRNDGNQVIVKLGQRYNK